MDLIVVTLVRVVCNVLYILFILFCHVDCLAGQGSLRV